MRKRYRETPNVTTGFHMQNIDLSRFRREEVALGSDRADRPKNPVLDECYSVVTRLETAIYEVQKKLENFTTLSETFLGSFQPGPPSLRDDSEVLVSQIENEIKLIFLELSRLEATFQTRSTTEGSLPGGYSVILETQHKRLVEKMTRLAKAFQEKRRAFHLQKKAQFQHQYEIAFGEAPPPNVLEDENIFRQKILSHKFSDATLAYAFTRERYEDILVLEQKMQHLHQIMTDLAFLVETQNEVLDVIENNVCSVEVTTTEIVATMVEGAKLAKRGRKKMCIILSLIGCVLVVVTLVLLVIAVISICGAGYCKKKR